METENGCGDSFACEACKLTFSSKVFMKIHQKSDQHLLNIGEDPKKVRAKELQDFTKVPTGPVSGNPTIHMLRWISQAKVSLIGLDFIYEVQRYQNRGYCYYVCTVCRESFFQVFTHLLSFKHFTKFMIQHQNEVEGVIQSSNFSNTEKKAVEAIVAMHTKPAEEMFRVMEQNYKVDRERARIIVRFMCGAINLKRGRKRCNAVVELENSRIKAPRQVTLREQVANSDLSGRIDERDYPEDLLLKVWDSYGNFSMFANKQEMDNYNNGYPPQGPDGGMYGGPDCDMYGGPDPGMYGGHDGGMYGGPDDYWEEPHYGGPYDDYPPEPHFGMGGPGGPGGPGVRPLMSVPMGRGGEEEEAPLRMGAALATWKMERAAQKQPISLLEWLHKTVQKLDMEVLTVRGVEPAKAIIELLQCGADMFKSNPGIKKVCNYTKPIDPESIPLDEWLEITAQFLENGWLCSDREVRMATVVVQQIQIVLDRYMEVPAERSHAGFADPYDGLAHGGHDMNMGNMNMGGGNMQWQQPQQSGRRGNFNKPYQRNQGGGNRNQGGGNRNQGGGNRNQGRGGGRQKGWNKSQY